MKGCIQGQNIQPGKKFESCLLKTCVFFVLFVCLFVCVWGLFVPVNNAVMLSRSVNSGTVPGQA